MRVHKVKIFAQLFENFVFGVVSVFSVFIFFGFGLTELGNYLKYGNNLEANGHNDSR